MNIDKKYWHNCKICNKSIKELAELYGGSGVYYTDVFCKHLNNDHQMTAEEYFEQYTTRPMCECGVCNQRVDTSYKGKSDFSWKSYKCGLNNGVKKWSEWAKTGRSGDKNPMYQKTPWNKNKTKETSRIMKTVSEKMKNRKISDETKLKQSQAAKARTIHGHSGHKHTEESKDKMRIATLNAIKNGKIPQTKTKCHLEMAKILTELGVAFQEEYVIKHWSFDFFLTDFHILIEVDGDYFHSNPKFYPEPKTKTQKINSYRDKKKNDFCFNNHHALIRIWEDDILNNKEDIICKLKKLLIFTK